MKTNLGSGSGRLLCNAKRTCSAATSIAASAALLFAGGLVFQAAGQADDFNDGNDTSPAPAWSRYNPLGGGTWSFPGGNSYRIQAAASPDPGNYGPGRSASLRPVTYTNFYVAVDIVNWDDSLHQVAGVMARIGNVGPGTTTGYLFSHDRGNPLSSTAGDMDIVRLDNESPTGLTTFGSDSIHFEPGKSYRLVFIGLGSNFVGQVYELPDTVVPVLEVTASDNAYASGLSGMLVADNTSPTYDGAADTTFDNFLAAAGEPYLFDNFNDGNDTVPLPAWSRNNPIGTASYSFPGGNSYRLQSGPSPDPGNYGPGRAASLRPGRFSTFYVSADVVGWDNSIHQVYGVAARIGTPGAGTTTGYLFSHDRGNPANSGGDMDIVRLDNEQGTSLPTVGSDSIFFQPGKQYRLVFMGDGDQLRGQVYELPNTDVPVVDITTTDGTYALGASGLVVVNNATETGYTGGADVTFDNFLMLAGEPRLTVALVDPNVEVSWPIIPYRLQSSPSMPPAWTDVASGIVRLSSRYVYSAPWASPPKYFRLVYP